MSGEAVKKENAVHLAALRRAVQVEHTRIESIIAEKQKQIEEHKALMERLDDLPKKLSHDIMVPFGTVGYMPGKIVRTNEVLMLLGDNYFVERSCYDANLCLGRRVNLLEEVVRSSEEQITLTKNQLNYAEQLFSTKSENEEEFEIMEPFDEEKEKLFMQKRQQRVPCSPIAQSSSDQRDDFMKRLDQLELEEIANGELDEEMTEIKPPPGVSSEEYIKLIARLDEEDETSSEELLSDQDEEEDEEEGDYEIEEEVPQVPKKNVPQDLDSDDSLEEDSPPAKNDPKLSRKRSVTFAESFESREIRSDEPVVSVIKDVTKAVPEHPSSILRNKDIKSPCDESAIEAMKAAERGPLVVPGSQTAFTGQIVERHVADFCNNQPSTSAEEPAKRVSKFKSRRAK